MTQLKTKEFYELRDYGILYGINKKVLMPLGYKMFFDINTQTGEVEGWHVEKHDGSEYDDEANTAGRAKLEKLLREVNE